MIISALYIYPIKSLGGIAVQNTIVEERGFQYDRRWVLADAHNRFMTQREHAQMALITVKIQDNGLEVSYKNSSIEPLNIPFVPETDDAQIITIWDDEVRCLRVSAIADAWFSKVLEQETRLFFQPNDSVRAVDKKYASETDHTSMSDGFPILIISEASINNLNEKSSENIDIQRFRPNIVFQNTIPHQEDGFAQIAINGVLLEGVKPCARCVMTTINPETATKGREPLATLNVYRKWNNKILFGENLLIKKTGKISVGDTLNILTTKVPKL